MLVLIFMLLSALSAVAAGIGMGWSLHCLWAMPLAFVGSFVGWVILAILFLLAVSLPLDAGKLYTKDSRFYRCVTNLYIDMIIKLVGLRIEVKGLEKRPEGGRFLLVSNHLHEIDPGILMHYFPKSQLAFVAKKEVADMFLVGKFLPKLCSQYLDRSNDREALKSIIRCIQLLKDDAVSIGIFPEGGINELKKFKHLKPGVFKIAQKAKVPIVVCTLQGTQYVIPNLLKFRRSTVKLHVLEVVETSWMEGKTTVEIADYVHSIMAEDLGPENCYPEENT